MTQNEFIFWLTGYLEGKETVKIDLIKEKLNKIEITDTNTYRWRWTDTWYNPIPQGVPIIEPDKNTVTYKL